jgi:hypothetical protein
LRMSTSSSRRSLQSYRVSHGQLEKGTNDSPVLGSTEWVLRALDSVDSIPAMIRHLVRITECPLSQRSHDGVVGLEPTRLLQLLLSERDESRARVSLLNLRTSSSRRTFVALIVTAFDLREGERLATVRCHARAREGAEVGGGGESELRREDGRERRHHGRLCGRRDELNS